MAVYNGENYIRSSLESILGQTYGDFEFIIVNDCSTDKTLDIVRSYKDKRIITCSNEKNQGQTKSLNIGIRLAKGEYIARIDVDDISYPRRLEKQLDFLAHNPEFDVVGTSGHILNRLEKITGIRRAPTSREDIFLRIFFDSPIIHISALMRREKLLELGGYDERFSVAQDYDLWSRLLMHKAKLGNLKDILVAFRIFSNTFGKRQANSKGITETSEILYRNINAFTNLNIDQQTAYNLRKICVVPVLDEFSCTEYEGLINLFLDIFDNLKPEFKIKINHRLLKSTTSGFRHHIAMAKLRAGDLSQARTMFLSAIRSGCCNMFTYSGYLLSFAPYFMRAKMLEARKEFVENKWS